MKSDPYFEDRAHWERQARQPAECLRRNELCALASPDCESLLDVGCGAAFISAALPARQRVGIDTARAALELASTRGVRPVLGDAGRGALPFPNRAFDMACAFEVLEHFAAAPRERLAAEMQRVARRWLLVSVPDNQDLKADCARCAACGIEFHCFGHLASFTSASLGALFPEFRVVAVRRIGRSRRYTRWENFLRHRWGRDYEPPASPCPACGALQGVPRRRGAFGALAHLTARTREAFLPAPRWLLAKFERVGNGAS